MTETLSWIHFGDLHISNEGEQNHVDFLRLIAEANRYMRGDIAFGCCLETMPTTPKPTNMRS